jgi:hypothetical protein
MSHGARQRSELDLRDRLQIVIFAYENGMTDPVQRAVAGNVRRPGGCGRQ